VPSATYTNNFKNALLPDLATTERLLTEKCLHEFVKQAWPVVESQPFIDNWHIGMICEHLQAVTAGEILDLLVNIPPGCSKSLLVCVFWPMWEWVRDASVRWIFASYDQQLSTRDSMRCRSLLGSRWFQGRWGDRFALADDQNQKTLYRTDKQGYRMATSVGGHGIGEHPDRIVFDDATSAIDAESAVCRAGVRFWWDQQMSTRGLARKVRRVGIGQRLHPDDLPGHWLRTGGPIHVCLPMRYEPGRMVPTPCLANDPRRAKWATDPRTEEGQLLTPGQFPEEVVAKMERTLGAMGTAGQLQQRPTPRGGAVFKWEWFEGHRFFDFGDAYQVGQRFYRYDACWHMVLMDPAGGMSAAADYTAIGSFAVTPHNDLLIVHMIRERIAWEDMLKRLKRQCDDMAASGRAPEFAGCEDAFLQRVLLRLGREMPGMPPLRSLNPNMGEGTGKSPLVRSLPAVVRAENGQIWIPAKDWDWLEVFKQELLIFTGSDKERNDQIAVLSYAAVEVEKGAGEVQGVPLTFERRIY
jgi:hypothetical protein